MSGSETYNQHHCRSAISASGGVLSRVQHPAQQLHHLIHDSLKQPLHGLILNLVRPAKTAVTQPGARLVGRHVNGGACGGLVARGHIRHAREREILGPVGMCGRKLIFGVELDGRAANPPSPLILHPFQQNRHWPIVMNLDEHVRPKDARLNRHSLRF